MQCATASEILNVFSCEGLQSQACLMCFLFLAFNENLLQLQPDYLQALHTHENIDYFVGKIFKEMF